MCTYFKFKYLKILTFIIHFATYLTRTIISQLVCKMGLVTGTRSEEESQADKHAEGCAGIDSGQFWAVRSQVL